MFSSILIFLSLLANLRLWAPFPLLNDQRLDWRFTNNSSLAITATIFYVISTFLFCYPWRVYKDSFVRITKKTRTWVVGTDPLSKHWCWLLSPRAHVVITSPSARQKVTFLSLFNSKLAVWTFPGTLIRTFWSLF